MTNGNTIKERLVAIEVQMKHINLWMKGVVAAIIGSLGINIAL